MGKNARRRKRERDARRPRGAAGEPKEDSKEGSRRHRRRQDRFFARIMRRLRGPHPAAPKEKITTAAPQPQQITPEQAAQTDKQLRRHFSERQSGLVVPSHTGKKTK